MNASLVRAPLRASRMPATAALRTRSVQTVAHGKKYTGMPFDYSNRRKFAVKYLSFVGFAFALPFVAANYQLWKGGAFN